MMTKSNTSGPVLSVNGLTVSYGNTPVVEDVSFEVERGQLLGIIGPNGAGKSTMLKAIVGALSADAGEVLVNGAAITSKRVRQRVTYVPQRAVIDWDFPVTVYDVVKQGRYGHLGLFARFTEEHRAIVDESLRQVDMQGFADRQIGELSGGQQQRVFLARALAQQGELYLLDEPFAGVDARTEAAIIGVLRALREQSKTVLVVHHDLSTVKDYFDSVLLINKRLIAIGNTRDTFRADLLQQTYGGRMTILEHDDGQGVVS